jgi:hypothetical protein
MEVAISKETKAGIFLHSVLGTNLEDKVRAEAQGDRYSERCSIGLGIRTWGHITVLSFPFCQHHTRDLSFGYTLKPLGKT